MAFSSVTQIELCYDPDHPHRISMSVHFNPKERGERFFTINDRIRAELLMERIARVCLDAWQQDQWNKKPVRLPVKQVPARAAE